MINFEVRPLWGSQPTPFRHTWKGLVNIDQFRWLVRADVHEQLALAAQELGARLVRAVGMLDDEMRVLTADPTRWRKDGKLHEEPNWQIVTMIFERLLNLGIHPMVTTCFMPGAIAAGSRTVFETKARISMPACMKQWRTLVGSLVRHLARHFGHEVIRKCYFEVWNEPNLQNGFFEGGKEDFFELYRNTASAIKEVDSTFKVGGPSTARAEWMLDFLDFCRSQDLEPDYIIGHIYNNDNDSKPLSPFDGPQEDLISRSPHFAAGVVRGTRKILDEAGFQGEIHWNEWGRSWFPCDILRETSNEAAFIVKTMAEVSQLGDYFAYWCLSDIYDQVGYGRQAFHGNYGLLSLQGLRKPGYHAFQLLGMMGEQQIKVEGNGLGKLTNAIATTSACHSEVLIYAFDDMDQAAGDRSFTVILPPRQRLQKLYRITESENNIVSRWKAMGSPCYINPVQATQLKQSNLLTETTDYVCDDITVKFTLSSPGVALLTFSY